MASSIPVGFFLAWLCDDEVIYGKKWLKIVVYALALMILAVSLFYYDLLIILALIYMLIVTCISLFKSMRAK